MNKIAFALLVIISAVSITSCGRDLPSNIEISVNLDKDLYRSMVTKSYIEDNRKYFGWINQGPNPGSFWIGPSLTVEAYVVVVDLDRNNKRTCFHVGWGENVFTYRMPIGRKKFFVNVADPGGGWGYRVDFDGQDIRVEEGVVLRVNGDVMNRKWKIEKWNPTLATPPEP